MLPIKALTYVFDIDKPELGWHFSHEMTERFGMKDLSPQSFSDFSDRLFEDEELAVKFI